MIVLWMPRRFVSVALGEPGVSDIFQAAPWVLSGGAFVMSVLTYIRTGRWKESEGAKEIDGRLTRVEGRVAEHEVKLDNLPTKADVARIEADVRGLEKTISNVDAGVTRIEAFLMEGGRK
jgi:hypothetical protein